MRPSYRPRHAVRLFVSLSVCPMWAHKSKTKENKKSKWGVSKWSANFQLKRPKVKVTGRHKPQKIAAYMVYVFTYGCRIKCHRLRR